MEEGAELIFIDVKNEKRATEPPSRFTEASLIRELEEKGTPQPYDEVLADIIKRDYDDSHRKTAPLRQAEDAVLLDTGDMTLEESIEAVCRLATEARPKA